MLDCTAFQYETFWTVILPTLFGGSIGHPMKQQRDHRRHEDKDKETETATETETETETDRTGSAVQWWCVRAATQRVSA